MLLQDILKHYNTLILGHLVILSVFVLFYLKEKFFCFFVLLVLFFQKQDWC